MRYFYLFSNLAFISDNHINKSPKVDKVKKRKLVEKPEKIINKKKKKHQKAAEPEEAESDEPMDEDEETSESDCKLKFHSIVMCFTA